MQTNFIISSKTKKPLCSGNVVKNVTLALIIPKNSFKKNAFKFCSSNKSLRKIDTQSRNGIQNFEVSRLYSGGVATQLSVCPLKGMSHSFPF